MPINYPKTLWPLQNNKYSVWNLNLEWRTIFPPQQCDEFEWHIPLIAQYIMCLYLCVLNFPQYFNEYYARKTHALMASKNSRRKDG